MDLDATTVAAWLRKRGKQFLAAADWLDTHGALNSNGDEGISVERLIRELRGKKRRAQEIADRLRISVEAVENIATAANGFTKTRNGWISR